MAKIVVHAGDFLVGDGSFSFGSFTLKTAAHKIVGETIPVSELLTLEVASEENKQKLAGMLGWSALGFFAFGPIGVLAGLLGGGRRKQVTFAAQFKDRRKLLATTDNATFIKLKAAVF
ncbi:MAG: hypothetical protein HYV63_07565 [Candidatus Schekmanbacteria bacterium]|nr:hypothetical protein [Candidatus Schekmanbacteria bacterium]